MADPPTTLEVLYGLRGVPEPICDFCKQECPIEYLIPEEGGRWVCPICWEKWEAEEMAEKMGRD